MNPYRDMPREAMEAEITKLRAEVEKLRGHTWWERLKSWFSSSSKRKKALENTYWREGDLLIARLKGKEYVFDTVSSTWRYVTTGKSCDITLRRELGELVDAEDRARREAHFASEVARKRALIKQKAGT